MRALGYATALVGASALVLALRLVAGLFPLLAGGANRGGHFGGLAVIGAVFVTAVVVVLSALTGALGVLYVVAGLRQAAAERRSAGMLVVAAASTVVALMAYALVFFRLDEGAWLGDFIGVDARILTRAAFALYALHAMLTLSVGRSPKRLTSVAARFLGGALLPLALVAVLLNRPSLQDDDGAPARRRLFGASIDSYDEVAQELQLSTDATRLAVVDRRHTVTVFDATSGEELWVRQLDEKDVGADEPALVFSPRGSWLLYAYSGGFVQLDAGTGTILRRIRCAEGVLESGAFSADETVLVLSVADIGGGTVCFHDAVTGEERSRLTVPGDGCHALVASAESNRVWGICGFAITAWDALTGKEVLQIESLVKDVHVSPDGSRVFAIGVPPEDGPQAFYVFDAESGAELRRFSVDAFSVRIIGPLRGGWVVWGNPRLFVIDPGDEAVSRTLCAEVASAAVAADTLVTMSNRANSECHPESVLRQWPPL